MSVLTYIKQADEESRRLLREWLNSGHGHSTMSPEYFTSRGLPTDFVNDRCGRNWSNFAFVPRDCLKVSVSAGHEAPIGYFNTYGDHYEWRFLIRPQDAERGSLHVDAYSRRSYDYVYISQQEWAEFFTELPPDVQKKYGGLATLRRSQWADEYQPLICSFIDGEFGKFRAGHAYGNLYGIHHYHSVWSCDWDDNDDTHLKVTLGIELVPKKGNDGEDWVMEREDWVPFLTRMESGRRIEFIDLNKVWDYGVYQPYKGMDMESIEEVVDKGIEKHKNKSLRIIGGRKVATGDQWRTLSREELIQMHVDDRQEELDWYAKRVLEWEDKASGVVAYVSQLLRKSNPKDESELTPPTGWGFEFTQPLGYMDCMWNGNYFVPWVDGSGSSSMMHALCSEFGVSAETGMIGRGSHGRALGENLLAFLKEENVWGEEE